MPLLELVDVTRRFGGIVALDGVTFDVDEGEIVGLIGPNGAGKTTAFNVVTRLYAPDSGQVRFAGSTPNHGQCTVARDEVAPMRLRFFNPHPWKEITPGAHDARREALLGQIN